MATSVVFSEHIRVAIPPVTSSFLPFGGDVGLPNGEQAPQLSLNFRGIMKNFVALYEDAPDTAGDILTPKLHSSFL